MDHESACEYGLAGPDCMRTFASLNDASFRRIQFAYVVMGLSLFLVSTTKLIMAIKHWGSKIQKIVFVLILYISLTFLVRAIDPMSYNHVLPRVVTGFAINSCTSALYSIFYLIDVYWLLLLWQKPRFVQLPPAIRVCAILAHVVTWTVVIVDTVLIAQGNNLEGVGTRIKLSMFSVMTLLASCTGLLCGVLIQQRIEAAAAAAVAATSVQQHFIPVLERASDEPTQYIDLEVASSGKTHGPTKAKLVVGQFPKVRIRRPTHPLAVRMCKILLAIALASLAAIGLQMYYAIQPGSNESTPSGVWACANGVDCNNLTVMEHSMYVLQAVVAGVNLWAFRKINKANPNGVPRTDQ